MWFMLHWMIFIAACKHKHSNICDSNVDGMLIIYRPHWISSFIDNIDYEWEIRLRISMLSMVHLSWQDKLVYLVIYDYSEAPQDMKAEWRYAITILGEQFVMISGVLTMQQLFAGN